DWSLSGGLAWRGGRHAAARHAATPLLLPARWLVARIDDVSRWCNGIVEFSTAPDCLLRVAVSRATERRVLADRAVEAGEAVVELHLWNEHIPSLEGFSGLGWVARIRRQMIRSLGLLAAALES